MKRLLLMLVLLMQLCAAKAQANKFEVDGITYHVISMVDQTCSVLLISGDAKAGGLIYVPSTVEYNGRVFKVLSIECTETILNKDIGRFAKGVADYVNEPTALFIENGPSKIGKMAFLSIFDGSHELNNGFTSQINQVVLPPSVNYIGQDAFTQLALKVLVVLNPKPFYYDNSFSPGFRTSFKGGKTIYEDCTLYVPDQSLEAYRKMECWAKFWNIKGVSELTNDPNYRSLEKARADFMVWKEANDKAEREKEIAETYNKKIVEGVMELYQGGDAYDNILFKKERGSIKELSWDDADHVSLYMKDGTTFKNLSFTYKGESTKVNFRGHDKSTLEYVADENASYALFQCTGKGYYVRETALCLFYDGKIYNIDKKVRTQLLEKYFSNNQGNGEGRTERNASAVKGLLNNVLQNL